MLPISTNEKPQKILEVDDPGEAGVSGLQAFERLAEVGQAIGVGAHVRDVGGDGRDLEQAAALLRLPAARVVDDQPAHHPGGVAEEAVAVGEGRPLALRDVQIRLVQDRRGAERRAGAPLGQLAAGHPVQLVVERGEQLVGCRAVAALGGGEE